MGAWAGDGTAAVDGDGGGGVGAGAVAAAGLRGAARRLRLNGFGSLKTCAPVAVSRHGVINNRCGKLQIGKCHSQCYKGAERGGMPSYNVDVLVKFDVASRSTMHSPSVLCCIVYCCL